VKAIRVHKPGGPEALLLEDVELAPPAAGEARVRHTAIGVNFIDRASSRPSVPASTT
jgi:NADPH2:quinone reductase